MRDRLSGRPENLVNRPLRAPDLIRDVRTESRLTGRRLYLPSDSSRQKIREYEFIACVSADLPA
jgi:hypothetical protein